MVSKNKIVTGAKAKLLINGKVIMMADGVQYSTVTQRGSRMLRHNEQIRNIHGVLTGMCDFISVLMDIFRYQGEWESQKLVNYEKKYLRIQHSNKS